MQNYSLTIGADFAVKRISRKDGDFILQIWDIAGQDQFFHVRRLYYSEADAAFLVFDLTNEETFHHLDQFFNELLDELDLNNGERFPIIVLGNKVDLINEDAPAKVNDELVYQKMGKFFQRTNYPLKFFKTSAKTGENINEAFENMINSIIETFQQ